MANYMMDTEKQLDRQFSIAIKGFTFEFKTNYKGYVKWGERTKRVMRRKAIAMCREWADFIAIEAKKRCPHYSGGLEQAIKVSGAKGLYDQTDFGSSRMSISVGVDGSSWSSTYDDYVIRLTADGKLQDAMLAGPSLAVFLHENWNSVAGPEAIKRAARKGRHFGVTVGSHFLTRAYSENTGKIQQIATSMYKNPLADYQSREKYASVATGMLDFDEEIPF